MGAGHGTDPQSRPLYNVQRRDAIFAHLEAAKSLLSALHLKRFVTTFGGALWFHVMQLMFAFVYAIIEIAAVLGFLEFGFSRKGSPDCKTRTCSSMRKVGAKD